MPETKLSGLEKVAILLRSLPKEVLEKALGRLQPRQAKTIQSELAKIGDRPDLRQVLITVLDEAFEMLAESNGRRPGAAPSWTKPRPEGERGHGAATTAGAPAGKVDIQIAGNPTDARSQDQLGNQRDASKEDAPPPDPLAALVTMPADLLAQALDTENARTVSVLMNRMEVETAAQVYKRLTPAKRKEVSVRFTEQTTLADDLLRRIAQAVLRKCESLRDAKVPGASNEQGGREKRIAALLRGLERPDRIEMIAVLEGTDPELTARIKALLYMFEDILRMDNTSVQKLLSDTDTKSLALAMSGAAPEIIEKLFNNLSKRAQASLKEEIELNGNVPAVKSREARDIIGQAIQRLDERGEMVLIEGG